MTNTLPWRRTILQCSQIRLTLDRIFIGRRARFPVMTPGPDGTRPRRTGGAVDGRTGSPGPPRGPRFRMPGRLDPEGGGLRSPIPPGWPFPGRIGPIYKDWPGFATPVPPKIGHDPGLKSSAPASRRISARICSSSQKSGTEREAAAPTLVGRAGMVGRRFAMTGPRIEGGSPVHDNGRAAGVKRGRAPPSGDLRNPGRAR